MEGERYDKSRVNPDLARERRKATFDPERLTVKLDSGEWLTKRRREMGTTLNFAILMMTRNYLHCKY